MTRKALPQWLAARLRRRSRKRDQRDAGFIADRVEGNLLAAHQEIQKLALLFPAGQARLASRCAKRCSTSRATTCSALGEACWPATRAHGAHARRPEGRRRGAAAGAVGGRPKRCARSDIVMAGTDAGHARSAPCCSETRIWGCAHQRLMERRCAAITLAQVRSGAAACRRDRPHDQRPREQATSGMSCCSSRWVRVVRAGGPTARRIAVKSRPDPPCAIDRTAHGHQRYMHGVGRAGARRVARRGARPTPRTKNRALTLIAAAIERDAERCSPPTRATSKRRARRRLRRRAARPPDADAKGDRHDGRRPAPDRALPDPIGEITDLKLPPDRASRSAACACRSA